MLSPRFLSVLLEIHLYYLFGLFFSKDSALGLCLRSTSAFFSLSVYFAFVFELRLSVLLFGFLFLPYPAL